jgi:CheY-like chemotaxis protein
MSSHEAHKARPASSSSCRRLKARTGLRTLREAGYAVVECGSGEEAVALCRSKAPIDVLFTDIPR